MTVPGGTPFVPGARAPENGAPGSEGPERPSLEDAIPEDHPSLPGHFPGRPVVPGVVILQRVQAALEARMPGRRLVGLTRVKFLRPLLPGRAFTVCLEPRADGLIAFVCENGRGEAFARGQLRTDAAPLDEAAPVDGAATASGRRPE